MNKRVLILDGRLQGDESADAPLAAAKDWLVSNEWRLTILRLHDMEIAPCLGCFGCWVKTPGVCVIDDAGRDVAHRIVQSDLVVYLTPLQFGGYSYELKKAIDRSIPIISPLFMRVRGEVHHKKRYERYPRLLALGLVEKQTIEDDELFQSVVQRNAINMHAPKAVIEILEHGLDEETMARRIEWSLSEVIGR